MSLRKLLATVIILTAFTVAPACAGTQLQLQFKEWIHNPLQGTTRILVVMRNPTMKPFASVIWNCQFYDKENRLVGHNPIIFNVVPWGALIVDSKTVFTNYQFENAECELMHTEEVTERNERLHRASPSQHSIGLGLPVNVLNSWFKFDRPIQGRAKITSQEEDAELQRQHEAGLLTGPGYRKR